MTVSHAYQALHTALKAAALTDLIAANPLDRVAKPVAKRAKAEAFTPDEIGRIRAEAEKRRLGPLFCLCLDLGLRMGEALALRWTDMDLGSGRISVQQGVVELRHDPAALPDPKRLAALWAGEGDGTEQRAMRRQYTGPKTAAGRRAWPLPPTSAATLRAWRERQDAELDLARCEGCISIIGPLQYRVVPLALSVSGHPSRSRVLLCHLVCACFLAYPHTILHTARGLPPGQRPAWRLRRPALNPTGARKSPL